MLNFLGSCIIGALVGYLSDKLGYGTDTINYWCYVFIACIGLIFKEFK